MRSPLVVGNWKMNGSLLENEELVKGLIASGETKADKAICVPFVYLPQMAQLLTGTSLVFGAQDISVHPEGAYTGEVSAAMLKEFHCQYVIVGHSERRQYHRESNLLVAQKTLSAIQSGLTPIVCVGETLEQREADKTLEVVGEQLRAVKSVLSEQGFLSKVVVAYEPVWAIGTGLTATPEQAQDVHGFIRRELGMVSDCIQILYGGSVKAENAAELFREKDIDGALVGGASLVAKDFISIANAV